MNSASQNFSHHLELLRHGMLHPIKNWQSIIFSKRSGRCGVRASEPEQMRHLVAASNIVTDNGTGVIFREQRRAREEA